MSHESKYQQMLIDPSSHFQHPRDVLAQANLSHEQKLSILQRWEQDARELDVAQEEGMIGEGKSNLSEIIRAIDQLDPDYHQSSAAPNKQGNISS